MVLNAFQGTLQHTTTHCNTLQHTATRCIFHDTNQVIYMIHMAYISLKMAPHTSATYPLKCIQNHFEMHSKPTYVAVCCSVLQCYLYVIDHVHHMICINWDNMLQHTASYCNTLKHTATQCNTLQNTFDQLV